MHRCTDQKLKRIAPSAKKQCHLPLAVQKENTPHAEELRIYSQNKLDRIVAKISRIQHLTGINHIVVNVNPLIKMILAIWITFRRISKEKNKNNNKIL